MMTPVEAWPAPPTTRLTVRAVFSGLGAETPPVLVLETAMENLHEAQTGGLNLLFTDELEGTAFRLLEAKLLEAEEVRDALGADTPEFGRWLPVETEDDGEGYAVAPGELVEELQRLEAEAGEQFVVTRCEKSGRDETAPYEVNVERLSDEDQNRL